MSTRRTFLTSALVLPSAFTTLTTGTARASAQAPPAGSTTFADFESGTFDGWTVEGDAFSSSPTTDALFSGRIRGFSGRGFACSLHARKGNAATGRLISPEFTIERPFMTFKIGGGNFPYNVAGNVGGQACLNLVVDGKTERTATGDGTAQLLARSWDVSAWVGKKAHLEIVDSTVSDSRGYVMVDDIQFGDAVKIAGVGWRDKSVEPFFITRAKLWQGVDFRNGESPFPFDLPETDIARAIDAVVVAIHAPDMMLPPVTERSVDRIAARIVAKVAPAGRQVR